LWRSAGERSGASPEAVSNGGYDLQASHRKKSVKRTFGRVRQGV